MADKTIGDLTATTAGAIDSDDVLEIEVDGVTFKVAIADLGNALLSNTSTFASLSSTKTQLVTTFTTSARSLILADSAALVRSSTTTSARVFIPTDAEVAFAVGEAVDLVQWGSGNLDVVANAGATVRAATNTTSARAQYSGMKVEKVAANLWWLVGDTP